MFPIEAVTLPLMFVGLFWILLMLIENWLRHRRVKLKFALQEQMLQKFNSAEDLARALGSEGGLRYLESLSLEPVQPQQRILRAVQSGVVLACLGAAFFIVGWFVPEGRAEMRTIGSLVIALGIGFFLSGWIAHRLSLSWGLYHTRDAESVE